MCDRGKVQNIFSFVGTIAPTEAMRYKRTWVVCYLDGAERYPLDVYHVYRTLKTYKETQNIIIHYAGLPTLD